MRVSERSMRSRNKRGRKKRNQRELSYNTNHGNKINTDITDRRQDYQSAKSDEEAKEIYYVGSPIRRPRTLIIEAKYISLQNCRTRERNARTNLSLLFAIRMSFARSTRRGEESSWPGIDCPSCLFLSLNASSSSREWGSIVSWRGSNIRFNFPAARGSAKLDTISLSSKPWHFKLSKHLFSSLSFKSLSFFFYLFFGESFLISCKTEISDLRIDFPIYCVCYFFIVYLWINVLSTYRIYPSCFHILLLYNTFWRSF